MKKKMNKKSFFENLRSPTIIIDGVNILGFSSIGLLARYLVPLVSALKLRKNSAKNNVKTSGCTFGLEG